MQLTGREIELITRFSANKRNRAMEHGITAATVAIYFMLRGTGVLGEHSVPLDFLVIWMLVFWLVPRRIADRRAERYAELLRRFVNNDADVIAELAAQSK